VALGDLGSIDWMRVHASALAPGQSVARRIVWACDVTILVGLVLDRDLEVRGRGPLAPRGKRYAVRAAGYAVQLLGEREAASIVRQTLPWSFVAAACPRLIEAPAEMRRAA
jgi:hypothetical protein